MFLYHTDHWSGDTNPSDVCVSFPEFSVPVVVGTLFKYNQFSSICFIWTFSSQSFRYTLSIQSKKTSDTLLRKDKEVYLKDWLENVQIKQIEENWLYLKRVPTTTGTENFSSQSFRYTSLSFLSRVSLVFFDWMDRINQSLLANFLCWFSKCDRRRRYVLATSFRTGYFHEWYLDTWYMEYRSIIHRYGRYLYKKELLKHKNNRSFWTWRYITNVLSKKAALHQVITSTKWKIGDGDKIFVTAPII